MPLGFASNLRHGPMRSQNNKKMTLSMYGFCTLIIEFNITVKV